MAYFLRSGLVEKNVKKSMRTRATLGKCQLLGCHVHKAMTPLTNTQLRTLLFFLDALCAQKSHTLPCCISGAPTNHDRETLQNKESNKKALWKVSSAKRQKSR